LKKFVQRLEASPEAAKAEAIVFAWLRADDLAPEIVESPSQGGADFRCHPQKGKDFILEVTALGTGAVVQNSELSHDPAHIGGAFSLLTSMLKSRVKDKTKQLSKDPHKLARIVAITSLHPKSDVLLNRHSAFSFFLSDPSFPIHAAEGGISNIRATDLNNSPFFKWDKHDPDKIVPLRRDVSAVLLIPILVHQIRPIGILHPDPIFPFDIYSLYQVPLLRLRSWPILNGKIELEWTWPSDPPFPCHKRIRLTKGELGTQK
jgi:hypothetical protein